MSDQYPSMTSRNKTCEEPTTRPQTTSSPNKGFTLLELLTVLAIVGILVAIAIPAFSDYREKALIQRCCVELHGIELEIIAYQLENDEFPSTLTDIYPTPRLDPWNQPYQYLRIAGGDITGKGDLRRDKFLNPLNTDFDLYSIGQDGKTQTALTSTFARDDIVRANSGAYIGIASGY